MSQAGTLDEVLARARKDVQPTPAERTRLDAAVQSILTRAVHVQAAVQEEGHESFEPILVGSAAKDTWLPGKVDLDVFLLYPSDLPRARLESEGLAAGKLILSDWSLRYAEHPYVTGTFQGFQADVVPAYRVVDASRIQSAVDRTPFHNAWVLRAIKARPELAGEVRLMKKWLRGIEVYGAETAQRGVSGYLAEVITIAHDGFLPALAWLAASSRGARLDVNGTSDSRFPEDPLVVIDPVDPRRNAAAAVRADRLDRLRDAAQAFLANPSDRFFAPRPIVPPTEDAAGRILGNGGLVIVTLEVPEMREDAIVPHLERAAAALGGHLQRAGFEITATRGGLNADENQAYLAVRTAEARLPAVRLHLGPPLGLAQRAAEFRAKYASDPNVEGPFELEWEGTRRIAVRLQEAERDLAPRVLQALRGAALGRHVDRAVKKGGVAVREWRDALKEPQLAWTVGALLIAVPPWERSGDAERDYVPDATTATRSAS